MKANQKTIKTEAALLLEESSNYDTRGHCDQKLYIDKIKDLLREVIKEDIKPQVIKTTPFNKETDILVVQMSPESSLGHTQKVYDSLIGVGVKNVAVIEKVDETGFFILSENGKEKI